MCTIVFVHVQLCAQLFYYYYYRSLVSFHLWLRRFYGAWYRFDHNSITVAVFNLIDCTYSRWYGTQKSIERSTCMVNAHNYFIYNKKHAKWRASKTAKKLQFSHFFSVQNYYSLLDVECTWPRTSIWKKG